MFKHVIISAIGAATAFGAAAPALARAGDGVTIGHDVVFSVTQKKAVTAAAIGQDVSAYNLTAAIAGDVSIGRDATITVRQDGAVTAAAIGERAHAANVTGVITSKPAW